jgi:hypothetical protein
MPIAIPRPQHPLDHIDRPIIEALLRVEQPTDEDLVNAARLRMRHRGSKIAPDLAEAMDQVLTRWKLSEANLFACTRAIWSRPGWRPSAPGQESSESVGSGSDVAGD